MGRAEQKVSREKVKRKHCVIIKTRCRWWINNWKGARNFRKGKPGWMDEHPHSPQNIYKKYRQKKNQ